MRIIVRRIFDSLFCRPVSINALSRKATLRTDECGAVLLEFGLVVPFLVLFALVGLVDTGGIVTRHMELNSLSKDAVRILSKDPSNLATGKRSSSTCFERDLTTSNHVEVHRTICHTLFLSGFEAKDSRVETSYVDSCPVGVTGCADKTVRVDISVWIKTAVLDAPYRLYSSKVSPRFVNAS